MILLTGATGNVGRAAASALLESRQPFRVYVRDAARLAPAVAATAEVVAGDLAEHGNLASALDGVHAALLVTANSEGQCRLERSFVDGAVASNVEHVVKISSMEAAADATSAIPRAHHEIEEHIKASGMAWTLLRPNFFMQNLLLNARSISQTGTFAMPFGHAQTALIDARDVGRAAAAALLDDAHRQRTYELTGSELMDFDTVAAEMSNALGHSVRYVSQSPAEFRAVLEQIIPVPWSVDALCALFAQIANGALARRTTAIRDITGDEPTTLADFTRDFAAAFGPTERN